MPNITNMVKHISFDSFRDGLLLLALQKSRPLSLYYGLDFEGYFWGRHLFLVLVEIRQNMWMSINSLFQCYKRLSGLE